MRPTGLSAAFLAIALAVPPAGAQPPSLTPVQSPSGPEPRLPDRLDEAFREMLERLKPVLDDVFETMKVFEDIDGIENYERPEILPNGDILIRRREDAPPWPPEDRAPAPDASGDSVRT